MRTLGFLLCDGAAGLWATKHGTARQAATTAIDRIEHRFMSSQPFLAPLTEESLSRLQLGERHIAELICHGPEVLRAEGLTKFQSPCTAVCKGIVRSAIAFFAADPVFAVRDLGEVVTAILRGPDVHVGITL